MIRFLFNIQFLAIFTSILQKHQVDLFLSILMNLFIMTNIWNKKEIKIE